MSIPRRHAEAAVGVEARSPSAVIRRIQADRARAGHPIVVGISGYGGSGKTTLARHLAEALPGAFRLRGDDFLDPVRSHTRSADWDGVERRRLVSEALSPLRESRESTFRRYDWELGRLGPAEPLPRAEILIVDLIGLFHPEALPAIDLAIWCDVDLETATARGLERDRSLGRDHGALWREVWVPNERDFAAAFAPAAAADIRYRGPRRVATVPNPRP